VSGDRYGCAAGHTASWSIGIPSVVGIGSLDPVPTGSEDDAMWSEVIALGAAAAFAFFGWAIVLLTSSRHERLKYRPAFERERWRSF
jgi:hypothetical protein